MTDTNLKDFLACGAFLQTGPDLYKILIGPFVKHPFAEAFSSKHPTLLYKPQFWDFLGHNSVQSQESVYSAATVINMDREEFIEFLSQFESAQPDIHWKNVNEAQFLAQFEWSQQQFAAGRLQKTVPIIRQQGEVGFGPSQLLWCLKSLLANRLFGWSYGFFENGRGMLGHTPEILAQWNELDSQLHTVALAGTYPRTPQAYDDIVNDDKIIHEHQLVIDDIEAKLMKLSFGARLRQGDTDILELKHLLHLITEFELEVPDTEKVCEVIAALHPTAAMGLYPPNRELYKQFYEFSLQKGRAGFAAPFAVFEPENVACVVAIRNILFNENSVEIFSGCGITRASSYELELTELQNKRDSVKKMLGLPN